MLLNSLWPSDDIWQHRSGSPLTYVIWLRAPSHYPNLCWLTINEVIWSTWIIKTLISKLCLQSTHLESQSHIPGNNDKLTTSMSCENLSPNLTVSLSVLFPTGRMSLLYLLFRKRSSNNRLASWLQSHIAAIVITYSNTYGFMIQVCANWPRVKNNVPQMNALSYPRHVYRLRRLEAPDANCALPAHISSIWCLFSDIHQGSRIALVSLRTLSVL